MSLVCETHYFGWVEEKAIKRFAEKTDECFASALRLFRTGDTLEPFMNAPYFKAKFTLRVDFIDNKLVASTTLEATPTTRVENLNANLNVIRLTIERMLYKGFKSDKLTSDDYGGIVLDEVDAAMRNITELHLHGAD